MKNKKIIIVALCLALIAVVLCGCGAEQKANKTIKKIDKHLSDVTKMTQSVTVTDVGITVYTYQRTSVVDGDSVAVTTTEGKLGSEFTLQTTTTNSTQNKSQLKLPIALNGENITNPEASKNALNFTLTADQLASALNSSEEISVGFATVTCVLNGGKLTEMTCSFTSKGYKSVTINVTCEY